ncbi:MAG: hypothetical protein IPM30_16375 [Burkholderiales bacterium]|nr:hypothetical protein [Burkholderiales bacterium]
MNVTTEPPPADRLTRSSSSDDIFGTTVLITKRTFYSCSCGGVAYLSVFDDVGDFYKPALVFYDALGGGNEKYVADAISHEAGHNMSLSHDGTSGRGYYSRARQRRHQLGADHGGSATAGNWSSGARASTPTPTTPRTTTSACRTPGCLCAPTITPIPPPAPRRCPRARPAA